MPDIPTILAGILVGNQFPSSVSDCLSHGDSQQDGHKYCLEISGDDMELIPTWSRSDQVGGYAELDWTELSKGPGNADFIRIVGDATAAQGSEVIKAVSKFRQTHPCFVVTNAVKVEGTGDMEALAQSVEDIRAVNVMELLLAELSPEQQKVIRKLLDGEEE